MSNIRIGEYINIYGENCEYDAYVIMAECADPLQTEDIDKIEEALRPVLQKNWSKNKRAERCEEILDDLAEAIDNLGWGANVIVVK